MPSRRRSIAVTSFERTIPVGRSFGTVIVRTGTLDVQVTTFRSEAGYADARRPDRVAYGETLEGDSARRDFTCNALYLDPLDDDFQDPPRMVERKKGGKEPPRPA
jgi:tRNA nucleotidyltransferase (CCA-adding enzyme)